jgi:hypothetical protein
VNDPDRLAAICNDAIAAKTARDLREIAKTKAHCQQRTRSTEPTV